MRKMDVLYEISEKLGDFSKEQVRKALSILETPVDELGNRFFIDMIIAKKGYIEYDVMRGTYKKKDLSEYESLRKNAIKQIKSTKNVIEQLEIVLEYSKEIEEGVKYIYYNNTLKKCLEIPFMIEVCHNMMLTGASLTEIAKYVPESQMGDIYHLGERYLGIKLELTDEEKTEVEKYDEMLEKDEKKNKTNLYKLLNSQYVEGIPQKSKDERGWVLEKNGNVYNTYDVACLCAGYELLYPYYYEDKKNPSYANSFEELLEMIMISPDQITIEGLEKGYSLQEYNFVMTLREKIIEKVRIKEGGI